LIQAALQNSISSNLRLSVVSFHLWFHFICVHLRLSAFICGCISSVFIRVHLWFHFICGFIYYA